MGDTKPTVLPANNDIQEAPRIIIEPSVSGPGDSLWVFDGQGYKPAIAPFEIQAQRDQYVGPAKASVSLGDVASWVAYVKRYHRPERLLLTWSEHGLKAVLDAHESLDAAGRGQWTASHPFLKSSQWDNWTAFANGKTSWTQKAAVDKLDEYADDVVDPVSATLLDILRTMRATVSSRAESEYRQDGGMLLSYTQDSKLVGKAAVPSEITIQIPVLKGHTLDDGRTPVMYRLPVKIRPAVDPKDGTVSFRFLMPTAERVLEAVYADRVDAAKELLGEKLAATLYRATS